jgi:hypothetical protein
VLDDVRTGCRRLHCWRHKRPSMGQASRLNYNGFCRHDQLPAPALRLDLVRSLKGFFDTLMKDGAPASGASATLAAICDRPGASGNRCSASRRPTGA